MNVSKIITTKALCYITRGAEILVFRHPDYSFEKVGIQIPAGSVRIGETPIEAAIREAKEETGLMNFDQVTPLGVQVYDISPYRYEIQNRHFFHLAYSGNTPERWIINELHDKMSKPTRFECFWIHTADVHVLQSGQGAMIGRLFC